MCIDRYLHISDLAKYRKRGQFCQLLLISKLKTLSASEGTPLMSFYGSSSRVAISKVGWHSDDSESHRTYAQKFELWSELDALNGNMPGNMKGQRVWWSIWEHLFRQIQRQCGRHDAEKEDKPLTMRSVNSSLVLGWADMSLQPMLPPSAPSISTPCLKKTSTHIIGYKLRNSCPILIIFDIKIPHIIWHRMTA